MKYILLLSTLVFSLNTLAAVNFENAKSGGETCFLAVGKPAMIKIKGRSPAPKTIVKIENNKMYNNNHFMIHLNNIIVTYYTF